MRWEEIKANSSPALRCHRKRCISRIFRTSGKLFLLRAPRSPPLVGPCFSAKQRLHTLRARCRRERAAGERVSQRRRSKRKRKRSTYIGSRPLIQHMPRTQTRAAKQSSASFYSALFCCCRWCGCLCCFSLCCFVLCHLLLLLL